MKRRNDLSFIVELFLLFIIMLMVITVLTGIFVSSRNQSVYARRKTEAVIVAERVAEIAAASEDLESAAEIISRMEGVSELEISGHQAGFLSSISGEDGDVFRVSLTWDGTSEGSAALNEIDISVCCEDETEPIYTLSAGYCLRRNGDGT